VNDEHWTAIWNDQRHFNLELRKDPTDMTEEEKTALTSDLVLHLENECHELLRHVKWRKHRRTRTPANLTMVREELIDIFKLWMSLAQTWEPDLEVLAEAYWEKSAVVRRRHAEEFIRDSSRPSAIIDLDGVLADFVFGVGQWFQKHHIITDRQLTQVAQTGEFPTAIWKNHKHEFYNRGGFRHLPLMEGARDFIQWCRSQHWNVVFLTSRPIDRHPNILTDTIWWMQRYDVNADFVWWGSDKPAKLEQEEVLSHVQLVVDDNKDFIEQYVESGVSRVCWLCPGQPVEHTGGYWRMPSLSSISLEYAHVLC
jgi:NTP pyrophosphatase (non-canonical NTP hydrolase)